MGWVNDSWIKSEADMSQEPNHQIVVFADPLNTLFGGVSDLG